MKSKTASKIRIRRKHLYVFAFVVVAISFGLAVAWKSESGAACRECNHNACHACSEGDCPTPGCSTYCKKTTDSGDLCISGSGDYGNCQKCNLPASGCDCSNGASCEVKPSCPDTCPCTPPSCIVHGANWRDGYVPDDREWGEWASECLWAIDCLGSYPSCDTCYEVNPCYLREPVSTAPSLPSAMYYCVGGPNSNCVALSSDAGSPTLLSPPAPSDTVYLKVASVGTQDNLYYKVGFQGSYSSWQKNNYVTRAGSVFSYATVYHTDGTPSFKKTCDLACPYICPGDSNVPNDTNPDSVCNGSSCTYVDGYFMFNNPPEIEGIEVLDDGMACRLDGNMVRWTGDDGTNEDGTNDPLHIAMTIRDPDGYEEINRAWLQVSFADPDFVKPFNCDGRLEDYLALSVDAAGGWGTGVAMEIPDSECSSACTKPYGCTSSGCPGCYMQTQHPSYTVDSVTSQVLDAQRLRLVFTIDLNTDLGGDFYPEGIQQMYGMASNSFNGMDLYSGGANPGCSYTDPCRTTDPSWTWGFEYHPPTFGISILHNPDDGPDTLHIIQNAYDSDSGLRRVFDRGYNILRNGEYIPETGYTSLGADILGLNGVSSWEGDSGAIGGFEGGDDVGVTLSGEDIACNIGTDLMTEGPIGDAWIRTLDGDVFGWAGMYDLIPLPDVGLSTWWVGGLDACSADYFNGTGSEQTPEWCSNAYEDRNSRLAGHEDWFDVLLRLADNSLWNGLPGNDFQTASGSLSLSALGDAIYELTGNTTISGACTGRKILFAKDGVDVTVIPDIVNSPETSVCLLVGSSGSVINLAAGGAAADYSDDVDMAFVSDGTLNAPRDTTAHANPGDPARYDSLDVFGLIFSHEVFLKRDLVFEDNLNEPAEQITYNPTILDQLRDMLGNREFYDFECGIVQGATRCQGWDI